MIFLKNPKYIFVFLLILVWGFCLPVYAQQKIKDFYLSNLKDDGSRDWEVRGDEATVRDEYVDIDDMTANYFLEKDTIKITSDKAQMNKSSMDVYLEENVHIENKDGMQLDTDSLLWQRSKNYIETDDWVKTSRGNMQITATGFSADSHVRNASFEKDVEVVFPDEKEKTVTTATCSGELQIEYSLGKAVFNDNVVVVHSQGKMFSDKTTLFFDTEQSQIKSIVSEGNVKIIREDNITFAKKATYFSDTQKLVLEGRPRLLYYPSEGKMEQ